MEPSPSDFVPKSRLDRITTQWPLLHDNARFVLRYGLAIRRYLDALLRDDHDAEEVAQEFMLRVVKEGFVRASPDQGRFRHYLKAAVRNAAVSHLRRRRKLPHALADLSQVAAAEPENTAADEAWRGEWRRCVMERAWSALDDFEQETPGNLAYTVLRASVDHPDDTSESLAALIAGRLSRPLTAENFRKHLSRARRLFAEHLVGEVAETLDDAAPQRIEEELIDLGLMPYVREFLPADWRTRRRPSGPA